jgi:hypothetical protein
MNLREFSRGVSALVFGAALYILLFPAPRFWSRWNEKKPLRAAGGLYFPIRKQIGVPPFAQADPRWGADRLAATDRSLAAEGCAVTSAAMALAFYGMDVDPQRLNNFLNANGGYTERGWIEWQIAAEFEPGKVRHAYEALPSYRLIDWNLIRGNPVITRIRRAGGGTHFVLLVGKEGYEYLAQDPGSGGRLVGLSQLHSPIEALRYYERLSGK